jgi:hypothetical protein
VAERFPREVLRRGEATMVEETAFTVDDISIAI